MIPLTKAQLEEIEKLVTPLADWLKKHSDPYVKIIVEQDRFDVTTQIAGTPLR